MGYYGGGRGEPGSIQKAYDAERAKATQRYDPPHLDPKPTDRAINNSPAYALPDLDQEAPHPDERRLTGVIHQDEDGRLHRDMVQERNAELERIDRLPAAHGLGQTAGDLLIEASDLVSDERAVQHGPKERSHQNIADHWNAYLGNRLMPAQRLTALDVALMMVELKIARTKAGVGISNRDNYVDMAGYAGIAGEIALSS